MYTPQCFIRNTFTQVLKFWAIVGKKGKKLGFFLKTKFKYETILSVDCSTYLYIFWCALESEFWPLVELLAKEEIHSHFSLIIMQFSHRTFENFSSLSCTARDSSSYLVAWNDGQFILSTDWRRVKVWAHPLPQFNLLGSIFFYHT